MAGKRRHNTGVTRSHRYVPYLFLGPTILLFLTIFIVPIVFVVGSSFTNWNMLNPAAGIKFNGFNNYITLFQDGNIWNALYITFIFTVVSVPISMAMGLALALVVENMSHGKKAVETVLLLPMMVAPVSICLAFKFMFEPTFGIVNKVLALVGIQGPGWFASTSTAMLSVIIVEVWKAVPFVYIMMYANLKTLPVEPFEAARVDGGNSWQIFWYLTLPTLKPSLLVLLIIRLMDAIRTFDIIYVLTKGGPANTTKTLQYICYELSFQGFAVGKGSALAIMIVAIILITGVSLIHSMNKINEEI